MDAKARFLKYVDKREGGCWLWTGGVTNTGYGKFFFKNAVAKAHRVAYQLFIGEIAPVHGQDYRGPCVIHSCDNRLCVNPSHLRLGSHLENMADKVQRHRFISRPLHGEQHQNSKLRNTDIPIIRELHRAGKPAREIAPLFGVHRITIHSILTGKTWATI